MEKIPVLSYITDTHPVPEEVLDASGWFETEYVDVTFRWSYLTNAAWGPGLGNYLGWYMAQGWVVYDVTSVDVGPIYDVYEYTYRFKRRKLQSERVLQSLITEFTGAYNEGREVNDQRYDELVTIYSVMLDKNETQLTQMEADVTEYDGLIEAIIPGLSTDFSQYSTDVDGIFDDYGAGVVAAVNVRFDAELAKARSDLISRGMNNSTIWPGVSAGIERERSRSLAEIDDKVTDKKFDVKDRQYRAKVDMRNRVMGARERLASYVRDSKDRRMTVRNTILQAMLSFMERRTDDYPGLDGLANIAAQLGYGDQASTVMP